MLRGIAPADRARGNMADQATVLYGDQVEDTVKGIVRQESDFIRRQRNVLEREKQIKLSTTNLSDNDQKILLAIEVAIGRINSGEYGRCIPCSGSIPKERLIAFPYTVCCGKECVKTYSLTQKK